MKFLLERRIEIQDVLCQVSIAVHDMLQCQNISLQATITMRPSGRLLMSPASPKPHPWWSSKHLETFAWPAWNLGDLKPKSAYSSSYTLLVQWKMTPTCKGHVPILTGFHIHRFLPVAVIDGGRVGRVIISSLGGSDFEKSCSSSFNTCSSPWRVPGQSGVLCLRVCPHVVSFPGRDLPQNWHLVRKMDIQIHHTLWYMI